MRASRGLGENELFDESSVRDILLSQLEVENNQRVRGNFEDIGGNLHLYSRKLGKIVLF